MTTSFKKLIILILIVVFGWLLILYFGVYRLKPETRTFMGVVSAISDQTVTIQWLPVGTGISPGGIKSSQVSTIYVDNSASIIKESGPYELRVPKNSTKPISSEDVKREITSVSFDQLKKDASKQAVYVKILAGSNYGWFWRKSYTAQIIYYNLDNIAFSNY